MIKYIFCLLVLIQTTLIVTAQSVGIGTTNPNPSAQLDISSNSKGVLVPRMTTAQRKAISNPEPGLLVFDTDKRNLFIYQSPGWGQLSFINSEDGKPVPYAPIDGKAGSYFGNTVSMSGDYAAVGASSYKNALDQSTGAVYIFHRINGAWTQEAVITASDGASADYFGGSVDINGDYVAIGAPGDKNGTIEQGSAYVFFRNGTNWIQQTKVVAADGAALDAFGNSVAIDGIYLLVGSPHDDIGALQNQGSGYLYTRSAVSWSFTKKFTANDGLANDTYGTRVCLSGETAMISSPSDDVSAGSTGSVYVYNSFSIPAWSHLQKIVSPPENTSTSFASHFTLSDDTVVVASSDYAYTFYRSNIGVWVKAMNTIQFQGYLMREYNGEFLVTANPGNSTLAGQIWIYKKNGLDWQLQREITDPYFIETTFYAPGFGSSVSISGYNMIVGVPGRNSAKGEVQFVNIE
ncbi:MAG: FG-GAP repeat protein [Chitinophagaceae bacterium]|nr:FG-GAP repeat protein [Chitinophagaceae bacterium]